MTTGAETSSPATRIRVNALRVLAIRRLQIDAPPVRVAEQLLAEHGSIIAALRTLQPLVNHPAPPPTVLPKEGSGSPKSGPMPTPGRLPGGNTDSTSPSTRPRSRRAVEAGRTAGPAKSGDRRVVGVALAGIAAITALIVTLVGSAATWLQIAGLGAAAIAVARGAARWRRGPIPAGGSTLGAQAAAALVTATEVAGLATVVGLSWSGLAGMIRAAPPIFYAVWFMEDVVTRLHSA